MSLTYPPGFSMVNLSHLVNLTCKHVTFTGDQERSLCRVPVRSHSIITTAAPESPAQKFSLGPPRDSGMLYCDSAGQSPFIQRCRFRTKSPVCPTPPQPERRRPAERSPEHHDSESGNFSPFLPLQLPQDGSALLFLVPWAWCHLCSVTFNSWHHRVRLKNSQRVDNIGVSRSDITCDEIRMGFTINDLHLSTLHRSMLVNLCVPGRACGGSGQSAVLSLGRPLRYNEILLLLLQFHNYRYFYWL